MVMSSRMSMALLLAALLPAQAAAECVLSGTLPPHRKTGTAEVRVSGARTAQGRFPAVCGAYFLQDAPPYGKAGDGMVFEVCIPGVGKLQVSGEKRKAGPAPTAGLILNTDTASLLASGAAPNQVTVGADLFSATVKATLHPVRRPKPGQPSQDVRVEVKFDCSK
jgi:hypothetical protein